MEQAIKKAEVLIEALPYIKNFRGKLFVIKYGGSILSESSIREVVLADIVFLHLMGIDVLLVHGGGPNITAKLKDAGITPEFHEGVRITDKKSLKIVKEELSRLNEMLKIEISSHGAKVIGLEGSSDIVFAKKKSASKDLGLVGEVVKINKKKLSKLVSDNHIVILAPSAVDPDSGEVYNVNADEVASFVAGTLEAEKFVFLTDVKGVMRNPSEPESLISSMKESEALDLIEKGVISSGMIPKVKACMDALAVGVKKVHIVDAKVLHALLLEIYTDTGIGTEIVK